MRLNSGGCQDNERSGASQIVLTDTRRAHAYLSPKQTCFGLPAGEANRHMSNNVHVSIYGHVYQMF